jgi:hypothetical protein
LFILLSNEKNESRSAAVFINPSVLADTSPIFCSTKHPVRLRDTAGEEGEMYFFALISVKCDTIGGEIAFFFFGI